MASLERLEQDQWDRIAEVRIAGGGPMEAEVQESADRLQRAGRPLSVMSYLDKSAAAELITWADFMLIPSRIESIPVIFSDAMQCGTPVVVMPVDDLPRLLQNYAVGEIATEVSAPAFCLALERALLNTERDYTLGLAEARKDFDLERVCQRLLDSVGPVARQSPA